MKILVISDTHRVLNKVYNVIDCIKDNISAVIHCGDVCEDVDILKHRYKDLPIYNVKGNCDYGCSVPSEEVVTLGGKKIFITHGHLYSVNYDISRLCYKGAELGVDVCVFGHTHIPVIEYYNGITILNPGSLTSPRGGSKPSYGILTIENGVLRASIVEYK
ncbi:MAG: metallophosphoesterase family protein [Lachnospirales bacterium]